MNILFYIDFSFTTGVGHYNRSIALAKELKKLGLSIYILDKYGMSSEFLQIKHYNDFKSIKKVIYRYDIDLFVVDSYKLQSTFLKKIRSIVPIIYFSDYSKKVYADIFINLNLYAKNIFYRGRNNLLAKPYVKDSFKQIYNSKVIPNSVGVILGGTDSTGEFFNIYSSLKHLDIYLFTTKLNKNINLYSDYNINLIVDSDNLARELSRCEFIVTACSSTIYELIALKLPFCYKVVAQNQKELRKYLSSVDIGYDLSHGNINEFISNISYYKESITNFYMNYCNYNKFFSDILFKNIKIKKVSMSDTMDIYNLRDSKSVRDVSFNSIKLVYSEHCKYINNLIENKMIYKIVGPFELFYGYIRFKIYKDGFIISIALKRFARGKKILSRVIDEYKDINIYAKIKKDNTYSLKAFLSSGFKRIEDSEDSYELIRYKES